MAELFTSLPRHVYAYVERRYLGDRPGLESCAWFGVTSTPGRAWGLSLLLESGAVYSNVPPCAMYFPVPGGDYSEQPWKLAQSQRWSCHGYRFGVHEYDLLAELPALAFIDGEQHAGRYLFSTQHFGDGYSRTPEQAKQGHWLTLANGRLCTLPATDVLFDDPSFTTITERPTWLRTQTATYYPEKNGVQSLATRGFTKSPATATSAASPEPSPKATGASTGAEPIT